MDKEMISIIKSFEENTKNLETIIPLIEKYCSNTNDLKEILNLLNDSSINDKNKELNISISKIADVQKSIIESIKDLKNIVIEINENKIELEEYTKDFSKKMSDLENKIDKVDKECKEIIDLNNEKKTKMDKYGLN